MLSAPLCPDPDCHAEEILYIDLEARHGSMLYRSRDAVSCECRKHNHVWYRPTQYIGTVKEVSFQELQQTPKYPNIRRFPDPARPGSTNTWATLKGVRR